MSRYITLERMGLRSDIHMRDGFVATKAVVATISGHYTGECDKTSFKANSQTDENKHYDCTGGQTEGHGDH